VIHVTFTSFARRSPVSLFAAVTLIPEKSGHAVACSVSVESVVAGNGVGALAWGAISSESSRCTLWARDSAVHFDVVTAGLEQFHGDDRGRGASDTVDIYVDRKCGAGDSGALASVGVAHGNSAAASQRLDGFGFEGSETDVGSVDCFLTDWGFDSVARENGSGEDVDPVFFLHVDEVVIGVYVSEAGDVVQEDVRSVEDASGWCAGVTVLSRPTLLAGAASVG